MLVFLTGIGEKAFKIIRDPGTGEGLRPVGEGFIGILEITLLMSIIQDQISEVSSMELSTCNLT